MDRRLVLVAAFALGLVLAQAGWMLSVEQRLAAQDDRIDTLDRQQSEIAAAQGVDPNASATVTVYAHEADSGSVETVTLHARSIPGEELYFDLSEVTATGRFTRSFRRAWWAARSPSPTRGVVITLDVPADWDSIGGGSAALPTAAAIVATDPCRRLDPDAGSTGALDAEGETVDVRFVREKAIAAREDGRETFVVPAGQAVAVEGIRVVGVESFAAARPYLLQNETC